MAEERKGNVAVLTEEGDLNLVSVTLDKYGHVKYDDMSRLLKGYIEHITFNRNMVENGIDMWCNEEGKLIDMKRTVVVVKRGTSRVLEVLNGPILFTKTDSHGDTLPISDEQYKVVQEELKDAFFTETEMVRILNYN